MNSVLGRIRAGFLAGLVLAVATGTVRAQTAPEIGYMHPSGGQAGTTVDVILGGYDWTPDMQLFVHDPRIKLELVGPPSAVLVPDPPYWFGAKGRGPAWPLPREFAARLTIPTDVAPGLVRWQVANANGASPVGTMHVGNFPEVVEDVKRSGAQTLPALPVVVSGQIRLIEEVDQYEFSVPKSGPVTIELVARHIGSPLHGMLQVRGPAGKVIVDAADTEGRDLSVTFLAEANSKYVLNLHDLDFAGDRSYVYRLILTAGPNVQAAYPAAGRRGETRRVEFVGVGVATGANQVESVFRDVVFPAAADVSLHAYRLETPHGIARTFSLLVSDLPEHVSPAGQREALALAIPGAITGAIDTRFGSDQYSVALRKDEKWRVTAQARLIDSPLDLELTVIGPDGKELATQDDAPGTLDSVIVVTAPADGMFRILVTDRSGKSGTRAANYRLVVDRDREEFALALPALLNLKLGDKGKLAVTVVRSGGFNGPIQLALTGLPEGISLPTNLVIPEGKNDLAIDLASAADAPATAAQATVSATIVLNNQQITRRLGTILVATVMKPRCKITPEGLDDVRKIHRGSTFLAPLVVDRLEGFSGDVVLEMTAKQQRHRQGLASSELVVAPGIVRVEYPIFVPEWMETTKTSRMILNGVTKVTDPKGNVRTLVNRMELRIGILPEGALMKLAHVAGDLVVKVGGEISIPLALSRTADFRQPVEIELVPGSAQAGLFSAEPLTLAPDRGDGALIVRLANDSRLLGEQTFVIRATAMKDGRWPVVSETSVLVTIGNQ